MEKLLGVIDLPGGVGGVVEFKAALLASRGFAALALAYFAYDDLPSNLAFMELDYFEEAARWLSNHPNVLRHAIAVHANCRGALIAILLASFNIDVIKSVVAITPQSNVSIVPFMYRGKQSKMLPLDLNTRKITKDGVILRFSYPAATGDDGSDSMYPAVIPSENISCPILLIYGTGDLCVNSDFHATQIFERMQKQGKGYLCSVLGYPNAGHLIEPPYTPHCYVSLGARITSHVGYPYLVMGGEMAAHARAQEDAWPRILTFLRQNINVQPNGSL